MITAPHRTHRRPARYLHFPLQLQLTLRQLHMHTDFIAQWDTKRHTGEVQLQTCDMHTPAMSWQLQRPVTARIASTGFVLPTLTLISKNTHESFTIQSEKKKNKTTAYINISNIQLDKIPPHFFNANQIKIEQGTLNAKLKGEWAPHQSALPDMVGYAQIRGANINVLKPHILLKNVLVDARIKHHTLHYRAHAHAVSFEQHANTAAYTNNSLPADGMLNSEGRLDFNGSQIQGDIQINGKRALVFDRPNLRILLTPQLHMHLQLPRRITLTGKLFVPAALLSLPDLQDVDTLSTDAVIINTATPTHPSSPATIQEKTPPLAIHSHLSLQLGDNIHINAKGLQGQLAGHLELIDHPPDVTRAIGRIEIKNGTYTSFGETLRIRKGEINYIRTPIDNPFLHIEAIRSFNDVSNTTGGFAAQARLTVGVKLAGSFKQMTTTLFSEPAGQSQTDILSLLIFGQKTIEVNEKNKTAMLLKAATLLNFDNEKSSGIASLAGRLRQGLGLNELSIESDTRIDANSNFISPNTSLVLGTYLSPKLYIKYSVGLLEPINTLSIRYQLSRRLMIRTQTSQQGSGIDLLYNWESN